MLIMMIIIIIIDFTAPTDHRWKMKESEKIDKHLDLDRDLKKKKKKKNKDNCGR